MVTIIKMLMMKRESGVVKKEVQGGVTALGRGTTGFPPPVLSMYFVISGGKEVAKEVGKKVDKKAGKEMDMDKKVGLGDFEGPKWYLLPAIIVSPVLVLLHEVTIPYILTSKVHH